MLARRNMVAEMFRLRQEDPAYLSRRKNPAGRVTPYPSSKMGTYKAKWQHILPLKTGTISKLFSSKRTKLGTGGDRPASEAQEFWRR